ncbi:MAG: DNA recombination protein RmuC [Clostridia bacterium]|nr:DNA recombination protein RmuC [Clostridia bacterium]
MLDYVIIALLCVNCILLFVLLLRPKNGNQEDMRRTMESHQKTTLDAINRAQQNTAESYNQLRLGLSQQYAQMVEQEGKHQVQILEKMKEQTQDVNKTLSESVSKLQESNEKKLEQMRETVDEKLSATLSKRLDESFKNVGEQLKNVYESLGEMKTLAGDVSSLQKVLSNVKARGTFAEVQLGNILEETLTSDQFGRNISTKGDMAHVEFAIKIPLKDEEDSFAWLPIDSKFPQEDYLRLCEAAERGDKEAVEEQAKSLERFIKVQAKKIAELYIEVPKTTDFAIMFLPTEGLYAEVLRRPGLVEEVQRKYRIMICGPTTITAFLNTLSVGFRTLAISKNVAEVWKVLGATKEQYEKFAVLLEKAKKKVNEAGKVLDQAQKRNHTISRKLSKVHEIEGDFSADEVLGIDAFSSYEEPEDSEDE